MEVIILENSEELKEINRSNENLRDKYRKLGVEEVEKLLKGNKVIHQNSHSNVSGNFLYGGFNSYGTTMKMNSYFTEDFFILLYLDVIGMPVKVVKIDYEEIKNVVVSELNNEMSIVKIKLKEGKYYTLSANTQEYSAILKILEEKKIFLDIKIDRSFKKYVISLVFFVIFAILFMVNEKVFVFGILAAITSVYSLVGIIGTYLKLEVGNKEEKIKV